ncbi:MAG: MFS transporter [Chloroflexota bacterium]|nr:MFS transporter [Chloroflexota bacterium]
MHAAPLLNRTLLTLMAGHFTVDLYSGVLPVLYPILRERFALDLAAVGLFATTFTAAASLSQPLFGVAIDRWGSRALAPLAVAWMASFLALLGFMPGYGTVLAVAVLAGLGSGAYHPLGAANVAAVTDPARINTAMSLYTIGGTSGFALGPLVGALVFGLFGPGGALLLLPFGLLVAVRLALGLGDIDHRRRAAPGGGAAGRQAIRWRPLLAVLAVVMLRSWVVLVLIAFIPILYKDLGWSARFYSPLLFTVIIAGSTGTFLGGLLADRIGRRPVIVGSLALLGPAIWLFLAFPGPGSFALGALAGFLADASLPVTLTLAQGLVPGRVGMTSGLILGLGFVTGGVGVSITGALADRIGLAQALATLPALLVVALLLTPLVPGDVPAPMAARDEGQGARGEGPALDAAKGQAQAVPMHGDS